MTFDDTDKPFIHDGRQVTREEKDELICRDRKRLREAQAEYFVSVAADPGRTAKERNGEKQP